MKIKELYTEVILKYNEEEAKKSYNTIEKQFDRFIKSAKKVSSESVAVSKKTISEETNSMVKNAKKAKSNYSSFFNFLKKNSSKAFKSTEKISSKTFSVIMRETGKLKKELNNLKKGTDNLKSGFEGLKGIAAGLVVFLALDKLKDFYSETEEFYENQLSQETKLNAVLKNNKNIRDGATEALISYAKQLEKTGVVGDQVTLGGVQQLAMYGLQEKTLRRLMPGMDNLIARQKGINSEVEDGVDIGKSLGEAMTGNFGALNELGIRFNKAQQFVMQYGDEQQRLQVLNHVLGKSVGGVNKELASTKIGNLQQQRNLWLDIKETIGESVVPLMQKFYNFLNSNKDKVIELSNGFISVAEVIEDSLISNTQKFLDFLTVDKIKGFWSYLKTESAEIVDKIKGITEEIISFTTSKEFKDTMMNIWDLLKEAPKTFSTLGSILKAFWVVIKPFYLVLNLMEKTAGKFWFKVGESLRENHYGQQIKDENKSIENASSEYVKTYGSAPTLNLPGSGDNSIVLPAPNIINVPSSSTSKSTTHNNNTYNINVRSANNNKISNDVANVIKKNNAENN